MRVAFLGPPWRRPRPLRVAAAPSTTTRHSPRGSSRA